MQKTLETLHAAWRGRRVLLAGEAEGNTPPMKSLLDTLGARPVCVSPKADHETLARVLTSGRVACLIVLQGDSQQLDTLLCEAREAGVPLALLLTQARSNWENQVNVLRVRVSAGAPTHPLDLCIGALEWGARFLLGDTQCVGERTLSCRNAVKVSRALSIPAQAEAYLEALQKKKTSADVFSLTGDTAARFGAQDAPGNSQTIQSVRALPQTPVKGSFSGELA